MTAAPAQPPFHRRRDRAGGFLGGMRVRKKLIILHTGFGSTFVLGPFAWALCVFSTLLFTRDDWEVSYRTMRRAEREVTVLYDPTSPATLLFPAPLVPASTRISGRWRGTRPACSPSDHRR